MSGVRFAIRRLLRHRAATAACVATLGCSIGVAGATWSLLSAVLLRPLPVSDADRLVVLGTRISAGRNAGQSYDSFAYTALGQVRDSGVFDAVAASWSSLPLSLVAIDGPAAYQYLGFVTFDYFDLLGVRIPLGRGFVSDDDRRGATPVAVLSDAYWRRAFGASAAAVGRSIRVGGKVVTIVGVAARRFRGLDLAQAPDVYLPFHTIGDIASPLTNYFAETSHPSSPTLGVALIGRLRAAGDAPGAAARLSTLKLHGGGDSAAVTLRPVNAAAIPAGARAAMVRFTRLLTATVGLLLLIGCSTVGMLLLVRTEARREEFAVRLALGARRTDLLADVAGEAALLAAAGGALAVPAAWWMFRAVRLLQLPGNVKLEALELGIDGDVALAAVVGAVLSACVTIVLAGAAGLRSIRVESLGSQAGASTRMTRGRTRAALVVGQVAVAFVLAAAAGLFVRSLHAALALNAAVGMDRVLSGSLELRPHAYTAARASAFFDDLDRRLAGNPAIQAMAYSLERGGMMGKLTVDGVARSFPSTVWFSAVDPRYFRTMMQPVLAGRDFNEGDSSSAPRVAIVSESFARQLADGGSAIGRRVTMPFRAKDRPPDAMEVVGIVPDVVTNISVLAPLAMYFPLAQHATDTSISYAIRAAADADAVRREFEGAVTALDPSVVPRPPLTLAQQIERQMGPQRFGRIVLGALGAIALLLTAMGTYVLSESMAVLRLREMGIRAALGATRRQLGGLVFAEVARLVGGGLIVGLILASSGASTIRAFLFEVQPFDPVTLLAAAFAILTLAFAVSLGPALYAARVDLGRVLRDPQ